MPTLGNTPRPAYVYDTETDTWVPVGVGAHTHSDIPNTLVDAKGDLITATADNVPARLAKGADGTILVADSSTSTGLAWQPYAAQNVAGKNKIINGDFAIWQRGTSASMTSTNFYLADRWESIRSGYAAGMTVSRQSAGLTGFQYCARIQRDSGNTSTATMYHSQTIETINSIPLQGKTVTVSFWARAGAGLSSSGTYLQPQIESSNTTDQPYRSVGDGSGTTVLVNSIRTLSTAWQKFTTTATIPANATQVFISFKYAPTGTAGAADYYDLAGVQVELGSVDTPFTTATGTIQGELAACHRYYQRYSADSVFDDLGYSGKATSTTVIYAGRNPWVPFRVTPSSVDFANVTWIISWGAATTGISAIALSAFASADTPLLTFTTTGLTAGTSYIILAGNTANAYIGLSAEL